MIGTSLAGSNPHLKSLADGVVNANRQSPFTGLNKCQLLSAGAPTIYGVNRQTDLFIQTGNNGNVGLGSNGKPMYLRLFGDGSTTEWSSERYLELENAVFTWVPLDESDPENPVPAHETLTDATTLCVVLVVNGVVKVRVAGENAPGASQWSLSKDEDDYTILTAVNGSSAAYARGTILEVFMVPLASIVAQGPLTAGVMAAGTCYDFMVSSGAATAMFEDRV